LILFAARRVLLVDREPERFFIVDRLAHSRC